MPTSRRDLLKRSAATIGAISVAGLANSQTQAAQDGASDVPELTTPESTLRGEMLYRKLGSTGEEVSLIGIGGSHIGGVKEESEAQQIIRTGIDRGITFMDNCWDYHNGRSETRMGQALTGGYRDKVFLMSKIDGRTKDVAARQIDESLKRLQTDHVDLMQHHEVLRMEDPDRIFAEGGAQEAMEAAKKAGKIRYIGFTGHKDPSVHLRMLDIARQHGFKFDAVQMPLNVMDAHFRSFAHEVLPVLVKENIGVLGMKSMGARVILRSNTVTPIECLHYAMNLPTNVVITGIDSMKILDQAFEAIKTFKPMSKEEVAALLDKTKTAALTGKFEKFKTSDVYDGTAHNPVWMNG